MPTARPRHPITETPEVKRALDLAAQRWPEDKNSPRLLLLRLIAEGARAVAGEDARAAAARCTAIAQTSGSGGDIFGEGYLDSLREDWPA